MNLKVGRASFRRRLESVCRRVECLGNDWKVGGGWQCLGDDWKMGGGGQAFEVDRKVGASFRRRQEMGEALEEGQKVFNWLLCMHL